MEKGADVALVTDLLSLAWEDAYDLAILVSGDADFIKAVDKVKSKGKRVWIASFKDALSGDLRRCADKIVFLNDLLDTVKE